MKFDLNVLTVLVMAFFGGLSAYLVNQNVAVFHDGLRPIYPQYLSGNMDRKSLLATSFALCFGLVVGLGLPVSIAGKIILIHTVLLGTDIIGLIFKDDKRGGYIAAGVGALYSVVLMFAMDSLLKVFSLFPIDFLGSLGSVGDIIIVAFCVFPALAIAYQQGFTKGAIVLVITMLVKQITALYGKLTFGAVTVALNADGMALLVGIIAMIAMVATEKKKGGSSASAFALFENNIKRIKSNILILSLSGGVVALATTLLIVAEGPASLTMTAEGQITGAALTALGRCLGFIPLVMTTAIIAGVYSPAGTKAVHVPAILMINMGIMGLVGSFVIGCLIMAIEVLLLGYIAKGLDKFPGMKDLGDNIRTAMSKVLDLALLVG
ncbi:MAG: YhfT family protein, partial [Angelakisella sp.]